MYQKLRVPDPDGTVKVWLIELSPLVGAVEPAVPLYEPLCAVVLIEVAWPEVVQPLKLPVSKPPLVTPPLGGGVGVGGIGVGVGGTGVGVGGTGVGVGVPGALVGVGVGGWVVGVGVGVEPPQLLNLNEPMRVFQLKAPFDGMYSLVYQNVQPSDGSTVMAL